MNDENKHKVCMSESSFVIHNELTLKAYWGHQLALCYA